MIIHLKKNIRLDVTLPIGPVSGFTSSALPLEFVDIPGEICGAAVVAVAVTVTNADGVAATAPCEHADGVWRVIFAASCFEHYGYVESGVSVALTLRDGSGNERRMVLAVGDLEVKRSSPSAAPGDPEKSYQIKGADIYVKTRVIDGVQHYARQEMSYDAEMGAWGADWLGDYILVDGEFVPFQAAGGTAATVATALLALLLVPFSAFGITTTKEYVDRKDGEIAALSTNIVTSATNTLAQAIKTNSADIATLKDTTATINSKIPSAASASNQLADKEWIDDEIDTYAAYYITYTAAGAAFPTRAALLNALAYYSGGELRVPTRNDYAVVLADESHGGAEWRYIYTVAAGATSGQWDAQYPIETNDYDALSNKPQINGVSLSGNKTGADLGVLDLSGGTMTGNIELSEGGYKLSGDVGGCIQSPTGQYISFPVTGGQLSIAAPDPTAGNLAALDALGNPTDSLIPATNVATKSMIDASNTTFSNAVLAVGLGIDADTVAVINELVDSAHDLPVTGATSVGALLLALAAAIAALKKRLPYAISESIPLTVTSGAASTTLDDRTHNVATVAAPGSGNTTTITATLPPIVQGKSRDMFLNLTVGSAASDAGDISLSIVEPSGATAQIDVGSVEDIGVGKNEIMLFENALPTTSGNVTTTHWLVTVRHEDFT